MSCGGAGKKREKKKNCAINRHEQRLCNVKEREFEVGGNQNIERGERRAG
jgi:hypothetical protein